MHPDPKIQVSQEPTSERRLAVCPKGGYCEVAERQHLTMLELHNFKTEFSELKDKMEKIITLFDDAETIVSFLAKTGKFIRLIALTIAACGTIWVAITHWHKGH